LALTGDTFKTCAYFIGFGLFAFKASGITRKLIESGNNALSISLDKLALLHIIICTAGIMIGIYGINDFWATFVTGSSLITWKIEFGSMKRYIYVALLMSGGTKIFIGLIILLCSRQIARFLGKTKHLKSYP